MGTDDCIDLDETWGAHNYHPLPVVIAKGKGVWVWDVDGKKYMDMLSSYSAINQGHLNDYIVGKAKEQLDRLTLTSRAFHNDRLGPFLKHLCAIAGMEMALPMNTGSGRTIIQTFPKAKESFWSVRTTSTAVRRP